MSKPFSLSSPEFMSILKGLGIALAGAALTYVTSYITGHDFGAYTPVVVTIWSTAVNFLRKFIPDTTTPTV